MIADAIKDVSHRNGIVLDLFGGSGSTLIAAHKTGRRARLCELDPVYCDRILQRWELFAKDDAELMACGRYRGSANEDEIDDPAIENQASQERNTQIATAPKRKVCAKVGNADAESGANPMFGDGSFGHPTKAATKSTARKTTSAAKTTAKKVTKAVHAKGGILAEILFHQVPEEMQEASLDVLVEQIYQPVFNVS